MSTPYPTLSTKDLRFWVNVFRADVETNPMLLIAMQRKNEGQDISTIGLRCVESVEDHEAFNPTSLIEYILQCQEKVSWTFKIPGEQTVRLFVRQSRDPKDWLKTYYVYSYRCLLEDRVICLHGRLSPETTAGLHQQPLDLRVAKDSNLPSYIEHFEIDPEKISLVL